MKKVFFILSLTLVSITGTIAQNNMPPVYEIRTDTASEQDLNNYYWQLLEDTDGKWTIEQVSAPPLSDRFHDSLSKTKAIDTTARTYWFRYRLKNSMSHEAKVALDARSGQVDFFISGTGGKWAHFVTGYSYPWDKKDGLKNGNYIPLILQPREELAIFQRISNDKLGLPKRFEIGFVSTEKATQAELAQYNTIFSKQLYNGKFYLRVIFFGIILFSCLFNFFFFLIAREKQYLYFSLFLLSLFFGSNPLFNETFSREHPGLGFFINVALLLFIFFFFQFVRHYFQTYRYTPKWDKLLFVSSISTLYLAFIGAYSNTHPDIMNNIIILLLFDIINAVSILAVLFTIIFYIRRNARANRLFVTAILPFLLLNVIGVSGYLISQLFNLHFPRIEVWAGEWMDLLNTIAILWIVLFFSWILFRRYDDQKREIAQQALDKERLSKEKETERARLIEEQKIKLETTVEERTAELKQSLLNLQSAQKQIIQSEKMASLGELTAGIAHEIQNPLNFVNNFSEVSNELIGEMVEEVDKGNTEEVKAIANDIRQNLEKINHHGKRADAIVKGMLQHSRSSTGVKEPTDINALADEYLRLAFHGVRGKDSSFNSTMKTDFDETISYINIISQDIGRVFLNLYNNAFYAVAEKKKQQPEYYEPKVSVSTKKSGNHITITISDNGNGIPQKIVDKIFQPFFTTKPTGQGTGLGLSLSYDIVKAHGGEIKLKTKEGEGSEFIIELPLTK